MTGNWNKMESKIIFNRPKKSISHKNKNGNVFYFPRVIQKNFQIILFLNINVEKLEWSNEKQNKRSQ